LNRIIFILEEQAEQPYLAVPIPYQYSRDEEESLLISEIAQKKQQTF
jgi:hypothetical protein